MCEVKERLTDQYTQSWRQMLRDSTENCAPTELSSMTLEWKLIPVYLRIPVTKFRVSAHPLRIETGRYMLYQNQFVSETVYKQIEYIPAKYLSKGGENKRPRSEMSLTFLGATLRYLPYPIQY